MKRIYLLLIPTAFLLFSCGGDEDSGSDGEAGDADTSGAEIIEFEIDQSRLSAVEFNNELSRIFTATLNSIDLLFASDTSNAQSNFDNAVFDLGVNISKLNELGTEAEGGVEFNDALKSLLAYYETELRGVFKADVLPILVKGVEDEGDSSFLAIYDEDFAANEKPLVESVINAQEFFAKANIIKLEGE